MDYLEKMHALGFEMVVGSEFFFGDGDTALPISDI